jgi:phage terminase large subunit-like protein
VFPRALPRLKTVVNGSPGSSLQPDHVVCRRLRTADNAANLSPAFLAEVAKYHGTGLGKQELEGHLLEEVEGALWESAWIDDQRLPAPIAPLRAAVLGLDPSDGTQHGDEQARAWRRWTSTVGSTSPARGETG